MKSYPYCKECKRHHEAVSPCPNRRVLCVYSRKGLEAVFEKDDREAAEAYARELELAFVAERFWIERASIKRW